MIVVKIVKAMKVVKAMKTVKVVKIVKVVDQVVPRIASGKSVPMWPLSSSS